MTLNVMILWCCSITISNGVVSWVTSSNTRGLPSITSTGIECLFVTKGSLWRSIKSLSIKHVEALESNKVWILIILESIYTISGTIKQGKALIVRIGLLIKDCAIFSSCTVHVVTQYLCFLIQHPPLWLTTRSNIWTLRSFEAEAFIGQSQAWSFSLQQYKQKSSLCSRSFSFCNSFLKLEESIFASA